MTSRTPAHHSAARGFTPYHFFHKSSKGFTALEAIIYIALSTLFISGIVVATYPLFTGTDRMTQKVHTETEAAFLTRKISWALSSMVSISEPALDASGPTLTLTNADGDTLSFSEVAGAATLSVNGVLAAPLTSSRAEVTNLDFARASGDPETLMVEFDINGVHVGPLEKYVRF